MVNDTRQWLTPREAAAALGIALSTMRLYIRQGRVPVRRLRGSRLLRIAREDLDRLLEPIEPRQADPAAQP